MENQRDPQKDFFIQMVRSLSATSARLEILASEAQAVLHHAKALEAQIIDALHGVQAPMTFSAPPPQPVYAAPQPVYAPPPPAYTPPKASYVAPAPPVQGEDFVQYLQGLLATELSLTTPPHPDTEFTQMGIDSVRSVELLEKLYNDKGMTLAPTVLLEYPNIRALASYLSTQRGTAPAPPPAQPQAQPRSGGEDFVQYLQRLLAAELNLATPPAPNLEFTQMGIDSVRSVELLEKLYNDKGMTLAPTVLLEYPTIEALASYLASQASSARTVSAMR